MRQPRLLIAMQWHPAYRVGGAEFDAEMLGLGLHARRWDVYYTAEFPGGYSLPPALTRGLSVHRLVERAHNASFLNHGQFSRLCAVLQPDLYYNKGGSLYTAMVARIAHAQNRPFVWATASIADCAPGQFRRPWHMTGGLSPEALVRANGRYALDHLYEQAYRVGMGGATAVVCQTADQARALRSWQRLESTVIGNGHPMPDPPQHPRSRQPLIVWIANLKPLKRPLLFLELAHAMSGMDARFVMIGYPQDVELARDVGRQGQSLSNFQYIGGLSQEEVNGWLEQAHLLICTSTHEGLSNAWIQGWLRGVPTVSLGINPDDVLHRHGIGLCLDSMAQVAAAVRALISDREAWQAMSQRAREYARGHHGIEQVVGRYEQLFLSILDSKGERHL